MKDIVSKHYLITQQTPKDAAQFPSPVPLEAHSVLVIQTPFRPDVETALHSLKHMNIHERYSI